METETVDRITRKLWKRFGDRKQKGRIDLVYDFDSKEFYPVPRSAEHKDFMPLLEKKSESLIPVQFRSYEDGEKRVVTELLVGASSFEDTYKVNHPDSYLKEAYEKSLELLTNSDVEISPKRFQIARKFSQRA